MKKVWPVLFVLFFALSLAGGAEAQQKPITWKMQSTWRAADLHQMCAKSFVDKVEAMSGGQLKIQLTAAGSIVPAFEVLDAVHKGILDAGHGWPGYWFGKHPATTLFSSVAGGPFGLSNTDFLAWCYHGGGKELYNELLQKELKLNVVAFVTAGEAGDPQGWFKKPIKNVKDLRGLKFRSAGASALIFKELGMSVVILPTGEIVPAIQRGVIDGAEFSDPSADMRLGLQDVAKYYYNPGIHQPTGFVELLVNKKKWDELTPSLKAIVEYGAMATTTDFDALMMDLNSKDMQTLIEKHKVQVMETPQEILVEVLKAWDKVAEKYTKENPFFAKVYQSQKKFAERIVPYRNIFTPPYGLAADHYWRNQNPYKVQKP